MLKRNVCWTAVVLCMILSGCGGSAGDNVSGNSKANPQTAQENKDPVTVLFFENQPFTDDEFNLLMTEPVKKKYPYITIDRRKGDLNQLIASGEVPDLIQAHNGVLQTFQALGAASDIGPLVKKYNIDLGRFDPAIIDSLKDEKGNLLALPYAINFTALYYNKDIFDKFGVSYPKDGMTWDDAIELSKKVTREDGGKQYRGLDPENMNRLTRPMALKYVDTKTMKSTMNDPAWKTIFELVKKVYTLPGNEPKDVTIGNTGKDSFMKDLDLAMFATTNQISMMVEAAKNGLNWDVAQYPSLPGKPNIDTDVDAHILQIPETAKHKDAAMKIMELRVSDEEQNVMVSQTARVSPLKDPAFQKAFASGLDGAKGKHLEGVFKSHVVTAPLRSKYLKDAQKIANEQFIQYVKGDIDLNTALRQADEGINKYLASQNQ